MRDRPAGTLLSALLAVALWLAVAPPVAACSCVETTVDTYVGDASWSIFSGAALERQDLSVPFLVEEWFQGGRPAAAVLLYTGEERQPDGTISANTCGRTLEPGRWLVFALPQPDGRLDPGACSLTAPLDAPHGQELLAAVRSRLAGQPPPTVAPTTSGDDPSATGPEPQLLVYVAAPFAIGASLFAVLILLARRRAR